MSEEFKGLTSETPRWIIAAIFGVLIAALFILLADSSRPANGTSSAAAAPLDSRDMSVKLNCYCGYEESETLRAYAAIGRKDLAGAFGMINRGKIFALEPGDGAHVILTSGNLSYVRITSGFRLGEKCWMPSSLLQ